MKKIVLFTLSILFLSCIILQFSFAQEKALLSSSITAKDLTKLTFDELLRVEVKSASLTSLELIETPGTITTISSEEINSTPYRNLLDLLEVYVPSATFVNHWLGPRIGIRGVMSDQNYSYLLLVDGQNMNLQAENGPIFEIQNKDLSDIEKIEITSGPGSVIHGPGAIGGVISITTKNAKTSDKTAIEIDHNFTYRYSTLKGNYSLSKNDFAVYLYSSISTSEGIKDPMFYYVDRAHGYGYGYMSETWGNKGLGTAAPNFYGDFQNMPEIKVHLGIDFLKEFTFEARYTNFSFIKQQQQTFALEGPASPGLYGQQFTSFVKNDHVFSEKLNIQSSMGFQSQSQGDIQLYQGINKPFDDITHRRMSYSENKINLRSILSYQSNDDLEIALGSEYTQWYYTPEWGKANNSFVFDFPSPIKFAVLDTSSEFYAHYKPSGIVTHIDKAIFAHQLSGFVEINYQALKNTTILFSERLDKHNMAQLAISPRLALIQKVNKNNYLKLIAQQSVRLPNFRELYAINYASGNAVTPETLQGIELIYTRVQSEYFTMNASAFYQSIDQIAWIDDDISGLIGTFQTAGIETDISYKINKLNLKLSYSFIEQLGWNPENEVIAYLSNIGADSLDIPLLDAGSNRLNNIPQHQLKFVTSYTINKSVHLHFNSRFASGYGQVDMLNMFKSIHDEFGMDHTKNEMTAIYNDLLDKGYGKPSFTSNLSLRYKLPLKKIDLSISAQVMNLLSLNNIRYVYQFWEDGDNRQYPRQVGFVEEPLTLGLTLNASF